MLSSGMEAKRLGTEELNLWSSRWKVFVNQLSVQHHFPKMCVVASHPCCGRDRQPLKHLASLPWKKKDRPADSATHDAPHVGATTLGPALDLGIAAAHHGIPKTHGKTMEKTKNCISGIPGCYAQIGDLWVALFLFKDSWAFQRTQIMQSCNQATKKTPKIHSLLRLLHISARPLEHL